MFRVRQMTPSGDMTFGHGLANFFIDEAAATAQSVKTRLGLWTGTWFVNLAAGTAWSAIVGQVNARATADAILRERLIDTFGVRSIVGWWSGFDPVTRVYAAGAVLDTIWGDLLFGFGSQGDSFVLDVSILGGGGALS